MPVPEKDICFIVFKLINLMSVDSPGFLIVSRKKTHKSDVIMPHGSVKLDIICCLVCK